MPGRAMRRPIRPAIKTTPIQSSGERTSFLSIDSSSGRSPAASVPKRPRGRSASVPKSCLGRDATAGDLRGTAAHPYIGRQICPASAAAHAETVSDHLHVARAFDEIALLLALSGESAFKVRAYERGAQIVMDLGERLDALIEEGQLTDVEGIGEKLATPITELTSTGT